MTPERWQQVDEVLQRALGLDTPGRTALLAEVGAADSALRHEVESLLAADTPSVDFLGGDAIADAAPFLEAGSAEDSLADVDVGPYQIERFIGGGGMGQVYLARDRRLDRRVALKLLDTATGDTESRWRFVKEARLASALDHPNVCTIHDVGEADGRPFIAMQYLEGRTLKEVIDGRPMDIETLSSIAQQVAEALTAAHEHGIIHRDVKAANVMVTPQGQAKVLDFGIAKRLGDEGAAIGETEITATGVVLGTPTSMSPEQAAGAKTDHRSDIFSFGAMLYEMATGQPPFARPTRAEVMSAVLHESQAPAYTLSPDVPGWLSDLIDRALAKTPGARFQSMQEVLAALRAQTIDARRSHALAPRPWSLGRRRAIAVVAGVLAAVAILATTLMRTRPAVPAPIRTLAVLPFKPLTTEARDEALEMGIAEALIVRLAQIPEMTVRPLTAVRKYAAMDADAAVVGREQQVDAVLDGRVQRSGDKVRLTVRLVRAGSAEPLWSDQFDGSVSAIFDIQDKVVEGAATALTGGISRDARLRLTRRDTDDPEAYRLYLMGRFAISKLTEKSITEAVGYLEEAVKRDPRYTVAYATLADMYLTSGNYALMPTNDAYAKAEQTALKAIEIDESVAEAHAVLGRVKRMARWDWAGGMRETLRAVELDPANPTVRVEYALQLICQADFAEAQAQTDRALEFDPISPSLHRLRGHVFLMSRRFDEALVQYERALQLRPGWWLPLYESGDANYMTGRYDEAVTSWLDADRAVGADPAIVAAMRSAYDTSGLAAYFRKRIELLENKKLPALFAEPDLAVAYASVNDVDRAFAALERAYKNRSYSLGVLKVEFRFDPLRSDPRYADLMRRVGLTE